MIAHLLFEQSGTFRDEFRKLGIEAYDYDIITKEVNDVYKNGDIMKMLNLINIYNKKVRYDEDGIATNLGEVLNEIRERNIP